MATVGNLFINVNARTAKFQKGMKAASGRIRAFKMAVAGIAGAVAGAFAVAAITRWVKASMTGIDEMAKLAHSIGITVAELQIFRHAAQLAGMEVSKADKGLRDMVRRVGEAATGTGEASDALRALGLDSRKLAQMDAPDMFGQIADAINLIPGAAAKADLAYGIFGRSGIELINVMRDGSAGMAAMRSELEGMGALISETAARDIEMANDAIHRLGVAAEDLRNDFAVGLAPSITDIADDMREMKSATNEAEDAGRNLGQSLQFLVGVGASLASTYNTLVDDLSASLANLHQLFTDPKAFFFGPNIGISDAQDDLNDFRSSMEAASDIMNEIPVFEPFAGGAVERGLSSEEFARQLMAGTLDTAAAVEAPTRIGLPADIEAPEVPEWRFDPVADAIERGVVVTYGDAAKQAGETFGDGLADGISAALEEENPLLAIAEKWADTPVGALEGLDKQIRELESTWDDVFASWEAGGLDTGIMDASINQIRKRLAELNTQRDALLAPPPAVMPDISPMDMPQLSMELDIPDLRGMVDTLDTAIGGMKVEGDQQGHVLQRTLEIERQQLEVDREILRSIQELGAMNTMLGLLQ